MMRSMVFLLSMQSRANRVSQKTENHREKVEKSGDVVLNAVANARGVRVSADRDTRLLNPFE